jgi:hypothetical protein
VGAGRRSAWGARAAAGWSGRQPSDMVEGVTPALGRSGIDLGGCFDGEMRE